MTIEEIFSSFNMRERPSHPNNYRGMCWFRENHEDGSGRNSMFVSAERNSYHCFSCGESGSLLHALTTQFDVPVFKALDLVTLIPDFNDDDKPERKIINRLLPIKRPPYYLSRGFTENQLSHWSVGQERDKDGRDLIIVPFFFNKHLIAIQYIHVKPSGQKTIWTTEFDKSDYFYGYDFCDKLSDELTIVEGITDTWRVFFWGLNVVGSLGTELTDAHLRLMRRNFPNLKTVFLAHDNDLAGIEARENAYYLLRRDFDVRFLIYPNKDPDECPESDFLAAYDDAPNYAEYQIIMQSAIPDFYPDIQDKAEKRAEKKGLL